MQHTRENTKRLVYEYLFWVLFENYKKREQKRNEQIKTILTIVTTTRKELKKINIHELHTFRTSQYP